VKREIQAMVGPLGPNGYVDHFQGCYEGGKWSEALSIIAAPATLVDGGWFMVGRTTYSSPPSRRNKLYRR
jgi:hypothetical protein